MAEAYPEALKIRLVQDNLNTHDPSAFYELLPADQAFALAQRFEFFFTPKSASWLNLIELEFSALARLCLDRRIPTFQQLETEILTFLAERDRLQLKLNWQFSLQAARLKLNSHYSKLLPVNSKFVLS